MSRPSIGAMRHRLVIEQVARLADDGGGAVETWTALGEVWGAVVPVSGAERIGGEALSGDVTHVVHLRHRPDLQPAMRMRLGTRLLEILAVIDVDERRRRLRCLCRERDL